MTGLTRRQLELLVALKIYISEHGYSPNFSELAVSMGLSAKSNICRLLDRLAERGFIHRLPHAARSIALTEAGLAVASKFALCAVSRETSAKVAA